MGRIVVTEFVSLDGVAEHPIWTFDFMSEDRDRFKLDELKSTDALLLGRVTYEGFAQAWPGRTDDVGYADRFNSMPKYVVSSTLIDPSWTNSTVISSDLPTEVNRIKQLHEQDIGVHGSLQLANSLLEQDLVDEIRLMVFPTVLGKGRRMFREGLSKTLQLTDTQVFTTGVIVLTYQRAQAS